MSFTELLNWRNRQRDAQAERGEAASGRPQVEELVRTRRAVLALMDPQSDAARLEAARSAVEREMGLVPAGEVLLEPTGVVQPAAERQATRVEAIYIDRYAVTNQAFAQFVADGGYDDIELWPEEIWHAIAQFVDQTGCPGPRYWSHAEPPRPLTRHPVVGICWYEAQAYAAWAGKRLPTPAEWQRAASWTSGLDGRGQQSRYPWGNSFDPNRANTWAAGPRGTVSVFDHENGSTPNGVYQLCGNVWEWVDADFTGPGVRPGVKITFEEPMGEVRGGAFDTYFESQATNQFRTGQPLLYRGPNVGFRCAISAERLQTLYVD